MEEFLDHVPLTEEEALGLFAAGNYPAYVKKMEIKTSKNTGNKFFVGTIIISDPKNGQTRELTTWFALPYLLKHAYEAAGLSEAYQGKRLSTKDLEGKKLVARVKVQEGNDQYPQPKNVIFDFVVNSGQTKSTNLNVAEVVPDFNDDLPF